MAPFYISKRNFDSEISRQSMEVCEKFISELGAEIHDELIQRLTVLRLSLDRLERTLDAPEDAMAVLIEIKAEFTQITKSIRKTSRILLPVQMSNTSFQESLIILCQDLERPGAVSIHLSFSGKEKKLETLTEIYLYRIVQELIHNAFKHSSAWHIWIRVNWNNDFLILEVEDDGTDFFNSPNFIENLRNKRNTLKMRAVAICANLEFLRGTNGLLIRVKCPISN